MNNQINYTFAGSIPPFKGKCDLAFATDQQKVAISNANFKWEVCGGFKF